MSDSGTSFWKMIALILLLVLIGVYSLYEWYDGRLDAQLAEQTTLIAQSNQRLKQADAERLESEQGRSAARTEIQGLKDQHQLERQQLTEQFESLGRAKADLERNLADMKAAHAAELAAEQGKTTDMAAARAELQSLYEAEKSKAQALQADLDKVHLAIANSITEHQAKIAELEQHINERIHLARTTPEDADLLHTAQEVGVLPSADGSQEKLQALTDELGATKSKLESVLAEQQATQERLTQTQAELERTQSALREGQVTATANVAEQPDKPAATQAALADLDARLATEKDVRLALQTQHEAALVALQDRLAETKQKLDAVERDREAAIAAAERTDTDKTALAAANARIQALESDLRKASEQGVRTPPSEPEALATAEARIRSLEADLEKSRRQAEAAQESANQASAAAIAGLKSLYADFAELNGTPTERGLRLRLAETELHFPAGKARLPEGGLPSLERIAALIAKHPGLSVRIEGHTDSAGGDALNLALSRQRADAVKQALVEHGASAEHLSPEGIGSARPIGDNATPQGRSQNRRVEIYITE